MLRYYPYLSHRRVFRAGTVPYPDTAHRLTYKYTLYDTVSRDSVAISQFL